MTGTPDLTKPSSTHNGWLVCRVHTSNPPPFLLPSLPPSKQKDAGSFDTNLLVAELPVLTLGESSQHVNHAHAPVHLTADRVVQDLLLGPRQLLRDSLVLLTQNRVGNRIVSIVSYTK